jgi:diguanylate cyclase (GGDEF)-like protein
VEFVSNVYRVDHTNVIQSSVRDITARKLAEASVQRANAKLSSLVKVLQRRDARLCLAMIDLDDFKRFNDTFGHDTGDLVLRESGRLLHENLRKSDIACRYGGEESVLVLLDSSLASASQRLEQVRVLFERLEIRHSGQLLATTTVSGGVAAAPEHGSTMPELIRAADDALYAAKHAGRNCVTAYQPLH